MKKILLVVLFVVFILLIITFVILFKSHKTITQTTSLLIKSPATIHPTTTKNTSMTITSSAFANNGTIPTKYTCDGQSINPPLTFGEVPKNTKSLTMLMDDPDAPSGTFDHWVIYNIPPMIHEIVENTVPSGATQGLNGSGQEKYTGPCPPDREHRYFFKLYALDTKLAFANPAKVNKQAVIAKMQGHIISQAELLGRYNRPQNQK